MRKSLFTNFSVLELLREGKSELPRLSWAEGKGWFGKRESGWKSVE